MHTITSTMSGRLAAAALLLAFVAGCSTPPSPPGDSSPVAAPAPAHTAVVPAAPPLAAAPPPAADAGPVRPAPAEPLNTGKPAAAKPVAKPPAAPVAAKPAPAAPPLALDTLEQRLKDTPAIGTFTKLTLKNQVDDLLDRFRDHYAGRGGSTLAQLRQSYDQLLSKVHGLLKDGDPALAVAIVNSREAIWGALADPVRFAKL